MTWPIRLLLVLALSGAAAAADLQPGWPVVFPATPPDYESIVNPMITYDIDNDGADEVIVGTLSEVWILNGDGTIRPGWPYSFTTAQSRFQLHVGNVVGDDTPEVVGLSANSVVLLDVDGDPLPGWPMDIDSSLWSTTSIALADVDGDGSFEVAMGYWLDYPHDYRLTVFDGSGEVMPGWPQDFSDSSGLWISFVGQISAGDVDFDGTDEIVFPIRRSTGGFVYLYNGDGTVRPGFPASIPPPYQPFWRVSGMVDLDGDGDAELFGTHDQSFSAFRSNGEVFYTDRITWPGYNSGPHAFGDIDGDGEVEIVQQGTPLQIIENDGTLGPGHSEGFHLFVGVSIADVDGDGAMEIIATKDSEGDFPGWNPQLIIFDSQLNILPGWPMTLTGQGEPQHTALGDLDGDGDLELLVEQWPTLWAFDLERTGPGEPSIEWNGRGHGPSKSFSYNRHRKSYFLRGDTNGSGGADIADTVGTLQYLFQGSTTNCRAALDVDANRKVEITDPVLLLSYIFGAGPPPEAPYPDCAEVREDWAMPCDHECP